MIGWRNTTIWVGLAVIIALFIPTITLVPRQAFFENVDAVCVAGAVALCFGHAFATWKAVRLPFRTISLAQLWSVGVFVLCFALALAFAGLWAWRALGKPEWLSDWIPAAFSRWLLAAAIWTFALVNFSDGGTLTINSARRSATIIAGAVVLASLLIFSRPWIMHLMH